jgi:hypothetical protein
LAIVQFRSWPCAAVALSTSLLQGCSGGGSPASAGDLGDAAGSMTDANVGTRDSSTDDSPGAQDSAASSDVASSPDTGASASDAGASDSGSSASDSGSDEAATTSAGCAPGTNSYADSFAAFDTSTWSCEFSCPTVAAGTATFALLPNIAPNNNGSWSKARFLPHRFTCGKFEATFALTSRPSQPVWWGIALWDDGPLPDMSQFNEINFGITTDESASNTQMRFESTKLGNGVSLVVDTGVDLYDGSVHVGQLAYDATRVELYFDGRLLQTITDTTVIPTGPMDFLLGTRLVTTPTLTSEFDEKVSHTKLEW